MYLTVLLAKIERRFILPNQDPFDHETLSAKILLYFIITSKILLNSN